jgi:hypothetical protein
MPAYTVTLPAESGMNLVGGADVMVVFATSSTAAKEIAAAKYDSDGACWAGATVTEIVADTDFEGWTFVVTICSGCGTGNDESATFTYVGTAANNTIDEIAAQLVILLNAHADIAGAAYNTTTQVLTIAETTDGLGDQTVEVTITPPNGKSEIASLVSTLVHEGASSDALKVTLPADAAVIPIVALVAKSV